ncbi:hypothetical protein HAV22_01290 [Massilia sp. TW-1]|uniref:Uncharacterized protein n=1 Tax=Telluria antibiotica TaxID=2717319 RepID=A0ABX0P5M2_9BURK|nr:hypothetical protein [Telluria antibiotica]NIA52287.1 hypothetical protein [Telluria antibiotica]
MPISFPVLSRGQLVQVHELDYVLATLDSDGKLDGLPFMPEMAALCGQSFRVTRRVERTCVAGAGMRRMRDTVFLDTARCDGQAHDGCQRGCQMFWKTAWLFPIQAVSSRTRDAPISEHPASLPTRIAERYVCQSTELAGASRPLSRWSVLPFLREIANGDLSWAAFARIATRAARRRLFPGLESESLAGTPGKKSKGALGLAGGDWVDVKGAADIVESLDEHGTNCGLGFTPTMIPAIGQRHQVLYPIRKIIVEQDGRMVHLSNTVVLDGVVCQGTCVNQCPRAEYLYWRESWLDRADGPSMSSVPGSGSV